jgi:ABC-2 type transport system permease protein
MPRAALFLLSPPSAAALVLLQRARPQRVPHRQGPPRHPGRYERDFKKYETCPSPRSRGRCHIDIFPERRSFSGTGHFVLQNKTAQPIGQIHITDQQQSVSNVQFDRPFHLVSEPPRLYTIYQLDTPLAPGEKLTLTFNVGYTTAASSDGNERPSSPTTAPSSTPATFPGIGYDAQRARRPAPPPRRAPARAGTDGPPRRPRAGSRHNLFTPVRLDHLPHHVSTSDDQIAIAPAISQREWHANGRHYFEYSMGDVKTSWTSSPTSPPATTSNAKCTGRRPTPSPRGLLQPGAHLRHRRHDRRIEGRPRLLREELQSLPVPQYRIMEFPRYRTFAQSFPNTVPFSEGIGFIGRVEKPTDIDFTYFVTAHELGHQWWAHQLIGGRVEGSNMMSETLAEYSALMVMQQKYGRDNMHRFLKHELDRYLRGRAGEIRHERPAGLVQREPTSGIKRAARSCTRWPTTSARTRSTWPCTTS